MRAAGIGALATGLLVSALLAGCTSDPKPVYQPEAPTDAAVREYDATLEPSAAVLPLVPAEATSLVVTDFDELRLVLGLGTFTTTTPEKDRARFWRQLPRTAALSKGMLRPVDDQLRKRFGFGQDDVAWEATYAGPEAGWVLAFHDDVDMAAVQRAVRAGAGPLDKADVDVARHLVTSSAPPDSDEAWGADEALAELTGQVAAATYVQRGCLDFDTVFGAGMREQLAAAPADALRDLEPLDAFALALGGTVATARLGPKRSDAFDRLQLADVMPRTHPEFSLALGQGVADPSTGRLGYALAHPAAAAELTLARHLPFAVCAD